MKLLLYIGISLIFSIIMYALVHLELVLMNKLINIDVPHNLRIRFCTIAFILTFVISMVIALR